MQLKAFVLLSGGMDSTTCLHKALYDCKPNETPRDSVAALIDHGTDLTDITCDWVEAISVDYGQRHKKEMEYARATCDYLGIKHTILDVGAILGGKTVMLSGESKENVAIPDIDYSNIKGVSPTYVPFRNGTLLSVITAHAQKYVNEQIQSTAASEGFRASTKLRDEQDLIDKATIMAKDLVGVYFGAHSEDAHNWAYPDCTPEFIGAMANAIYIGSYFCIRLHTPLQWLMKTEIVTLGDHLGVDFSKTWSCYAGDEKHCGVCPTCRSRKQAFFDAKVWDPTEYAND